MSAVAAAKEDALKNNVRYDGWFNAAQSADNANIVKTFSMIKSGAAEAAASVDASSGIIVKGLSAIGGGAKGLWTSLSAFGKIGLVIAGVAATVSVIKAIYDALDDAFILNGATAEKKMNDAFDAYDSAKAEVEQVNAQLAETQSRIDQLSTKGALTFVEQDELANLKETNRYLEMELDLKQKIANEKAVEAAKSASTDYKKNYADSHSVEDRIKEFEGTYGENSFSNLQYGNHLDAETFFLGDSASEELFVLKAYEQMYSNALKDGNKEGADLADLQSRIEDQKSALNEKALGLIDIIQKIQDVPEELRTDANKEDLQSAKNQLSDIHQYTDNAKWKQLKLDDIYSDQGMANARKSLFLRYDLSSLVFVSTPTIDIEPLDTGHSR